MNKDVKEAVKNAIVLMVITLIAGLALGYVYRITKDPIEQQKAAALAASCKAVFPYEEGFEQAVSFAPSEYMVSEQLKNELSQSGIEVGNIYNALASDGSVMGYAIEVTSHEGYGGDIKIMCGVTADGVLRGVSILEISETAGLGMRAESVLVPQIHNMNTDHIIFTKSGKTADNEIDAISGATITTTAFVNIVNASLKVYTEIASLKGGA